MTLHCTWRDVMREAAERLAGAGIENAAREARLLLAHALDVEPVDVIARDMDAIDGAGLADFQQAVARRLAGEPVSRIRGWRDFYGRRFIVTPGVLDPRPETELLVDFALRHARPNSRVLDLGVGSGCILLSILAERTDLAGVGVDLSRPALAVAHRNAEALGVADRAMLVQGSWEEGVSHAPFDLVVANPPYIPQREATLLQREVRQHDPALALFGGEDGLRDLSAIIALAPELLDPGGWLALEVGVGQARAVESLMERRGLENLAALPDLAGVERVVTGRMPFDRLVETPAKRAS